MDQGVIRFHEEADDWQSAGISFFDAPERDKFFKISIKLSMM